MKLKFKEMVLAGLTLIASGARAEVAPGKAPHRIDFNTMIEENNRKKLDLEQARNTEKTKEKAEVIKFIDMEISVEPTPSVADRRYNSVEGPVVVDITKFKN